MDKLFFDAVKASFSSGELCQPGSAHLSAVLQHRGDHGFEASGVSQGYAEIQGLLGSLQAQHLLHQGTWPGLCGLGWVTAKNPVRLGFGIEALAGVRPTFYMPATPTGDPGLSLSSFPGT